MKTCLECRYWHWEMGEDGYSEMTPGSDSSMECLKYHWRVRSTEDGRSDVRSKLMQAATCRDFEPEGTPP